MAFQVHQKAASEDCADGRLLFRELRQGCWGRQELGRDTPEGLDSCKELNAAVVLVAVVFTPITTLMERLIPGV